MARRAADAVIKRVRKGAMLPRIPQNGRSIEMAFLVGSALGEATTYEEEL
jgi:hypothetical protein